MKYINNTSANEMKKDITKDQWPLKILVDFNKIKTFVLYNISTKIKR